MKKITKKSLDTAVRNNDRTALFQMFEGNRSKMHEVISNLEIKKLANRAYTLAYGKEPKFKINYKPIHSRQVEAILFAKLQVKTDRINTNYGKMLIEGFTHIYWANTAYGHSDYNKFPAFENTEANRMLAAKINRYLNNHVN